MLIKGINDTHELLKQTAYFISKLNPEIAYLSIPIRPPAVKGTKAVSEKQLAEAWQLYKNAGIETELLCGFEGTDAGFTGNAFDDILNITAVHPLREDSMAELIRNERAQWEVVDALLKHKLIKKILFRGTAYYIRHYQNNQK
jgi:wyosine [tRNA(Phe)-imidazoG37] synthetase (radical SAM superfamily)